MHTIVIKYMGSKRNILDFVTDTIKESTEYNQRLYDLFGGSAVVGGAMRDRMPVKINDIQAYTSVIAKLYLNDYDFTKYGNELLDDIISKASDHVAKSKKDLKISKLTLNYAVSDFEEVQVFEQTQRDLINGDFHDSNHLFAKIYSGTYWSVEQCLWIDAFSSVARSQPYKDDFVYSLILCSLMFAMAYTSQSTGHYAQYRDLTKDNFNDILLYRKKDIVPLFSQKFNEIRQHFGERNQSKFKHEISRQDYLACLRTSEDNSIIYADPPYQFVHYSRFYHALETLVLYDYPEVQYKGRYRQDRHQSPFCIRTKVGRAFESMFQLVNQKKSTLILSYSDNGMISLDNLIKLAQHTFKNFSIDIKNLDHIHSTMGRQKDKSRDVQEILLICRPN